MFLLACAVAPSTGKDSPPVVDTDVTDCALDHAWLDQTPEVVEAEWVADWSYRSDQIDLWLTLQGLGWLTPTTYWVSTWRVRYTTQDRGEVVEATALVSVPALSEETPAPVVLWAHGTSGFEDACAPSIGAVEGVAVPIVAASRGYVVVAPDYLGLAAIGEPAPDPHPWIVPEPTGIVALDALRAVDAWLPTSGLGARMDRDHIVYWGWSEGGYTVLQADRRAPTWAPDYAPVGVIAAVPPIDVDGQVRHGVDTLGPATSAAALMMTMGQDWYGMGDLATALQPAVAAALPGEASASCTSWPSLESATTVEDIFDTSAIAALQGGDELPPFTCFARAASLPSPLLPYTGSAPLLVVTGEADTLVLPGPQRDGIQALCAEGYTIEHVACAGLEHGDAPLATLSRQIDWLDARAAGEPAAVGCAASEPTSCD